MLGPTQTTGWALPAGLTNTSNSNLVFTEGLPSRYWLLTSSTLLSFSGQPVLGCRVIWLWHKFSHNLHYYNTFLPSLAQTARLVPGLMKARLPKNEICCNWLAAQCFVIGEQLRWRFSIAPPLSRTASSSILPYQLIPREYWTKGSRRNFVCTDIAIHIRVITLLFSFLAKSRFW